MASRGRVSLAARTTPAPADEQGDPAPAVVTLKRHPEPPGDFSQNEKDIWNRVVRAQAANWFTEGDLPLLVAYCKAITLYDRATKELETAPLSIPNTRTGVPCQNPVVTVQARAAATMASMATKLRLSQSTRVHPMKAGTMARNHAKSPSSKPWEE